MIEMVCRDYMSRYVAQMEANTGGKLGAAVDGSEMMASLPPQQETTASGEILTGPMGLLRSSLISSDPKHVAGQFHGTHFNEWRGDGDNAANVPTTAVLKQPLPHLDQALLEQVLDS